MKKIIALLLAVLMTFSVATVAFATEYAAEPDTSISDVEKNDGEETTDPTDPTEEDKDEAATGDLSWILDLPFWTVGPALKLAKIVLKLVKVYVKLAIIFGVIDKDDITGPIEEMIKDALAQQGTPEEAPTEPEVEPTTAPSAA